MNTFMEDYGRGMEMLLLGNPAFGELVRRLGYPAANPSIPSAQVSFDVETQKIFFEINPNFIADLADDQVAAVLAHEAMHVLLDHLTELQDRGTYPDTQSLVAAQECIINDSLPGNIGFSTPPGTMRGMELFGADFSPFSTLQGYEFIRKDEEDQEEGDSQEQEPQGSDGGEGSDSGGSSQGGSAGGSQGGSVSESSGGGSSEETSDQTGGGGGGEKPEPNEADQKEADSQAGDGGADGGDEPGGAGTSQPGACGGVKVTGDATPEEIGNILRGILSEAVKAVETSDLPSEVEQALEELADDLGVSNSKGWSTGPADKNSFSTVGAGTMQLNWRDLLAKINPKVKDAGRAKVKTSWHAPRRRMISIYPQVILPTVERKDDSNSKSGDSKPSLIIALDMSGSIPTHLLNDLANLAATVPEELIKPYPITWSNTHRIFNPEKPHQIVQRAGTTLATVWEYAETVKRETGTDPYVLVITDGEYYIPASMKEEKLLKKWFWMAIEQRDLGAIKRAGRGVNPDSVYLLDDFRVK